MKRAMRPPNSKSTKTESKSPESQPMNMAFPKKDTKLDISIPIKKPLNSALKNKHGTSAKVTNPITESSLILSLMRKKTSPKKYKPKSPKRNNSQKHPPKNLPVVSFPSLK